jgi:GMP synthase (glutamine-hydrolysing)
MKKAFVLRHIFFEDLGTLETVLTQKGYDIRYVDPSLDDLNNSDIKESDLLIILGGPIGAYDENIYPFLGTEIEIISHRIHNNKPIFGICLGAQLIARALGAEVYPLGVKEIGFSPIKLTENGKDSVLKGIGNIPVLHWHGDQFDIPATAEHLASTEIGENQAFSVGENILGLQFHLEVDVTKIERWLVGHANEINQVGINPNKIRSDAESLSENLALAARSIFEQWLNDINN